MCIYGGTFRIIGDVFGKYGIEHTYVEMDDLDAVKAAIKPNTKMFFVETPTNPMMKVADIQALSEIAKSVGALMVVDNTFLTPYFQKEEHGLPDSAEKIQPYLQPVRWKMQML